MYNEIHDQKCFVASNERDSYTYACHLAFGFTENLTSSRSRKDLPPLPPVARVKSVYLDRELKRSSVTCNHTTHTSDSSRIVDWSGQDDPEDPQNWCLSKKWKICLVLAVLNLCITFSSSVFSAATGAISIEFGVSREVTTLATSLSVLGFAIGPIIWAPLSELYGRQLPIFVGFTVFAIFQIPCAVAENIETLLICRFFQAVFGCAPLAVAGGALADIFDPVNRGVAIAVSSGASFLGPVMGPLVGALIVDSDLGWRWVAWVVLIFACSIGSLAYLTLPESYSPVLLSRKASKMRYETKNWALHASHDEQKFDLDTISKSYLSLPLKMLFTEPILLLVTLYMSLCFGLLYMSLGSYPITFGEQRGFSPVIASLPFLSITGGVLFGCSIIVHFTKTRFRRIYNRTGSVVPEERLIPAIIGAFLLPIGLFGFAWTSSPDISWVPQVLFGIPTGAGIFIIAMQGLNYLIDVYVSCANSAVAGNTFIRSSIAAAFPLFVVPMYQELGVDWATSLLGFLSVAMIPIPVLFYYYGERIRKWSKLSAKKDQYTLDS